MATDLIITHEGIRPCDAKGKKMRSSGQLFRGLLALISRAYRKFSLWHHEFIKATRSAALMANEFIPTRRCHWYVLLTMHRHSWFACMNTLYMTVSRNIVGLPAMITFKSRHS